MKLGIIGLPQSGKTTIFNALTRGDRPTTASAGRIEVHTAAVDVPDPRVDKLSAMFKPRKTIYAKVTYADIAGLEGGAAKSGISGQLLNQLTQMDGFLLVVRAFVDENVPHPAGSVNPRRDVESMCSELLLNDLIAVERKLERLIEERKKGGTDKVQNERQTALFTRLNEALNAGTPLRKLEFTAEPEDDSRAPKMVFTGRVTGNEMQGTVEVKTKDGQGSQRPWKAKRNPLSMKPLGVDQR